MLELTPRPTLRDVAERAGVSVTTVERALAGSPLVAAASVQRIRTAIDELGYEPDERPSNPTIADVAERAGVSIATVSRVMSKSGQVRERTVERVLAAMDELDFVANAHARALNRTGRGQVALLSGSMLGPAFVGIAQGIESVVAPHGHQFVVHTTGGDAAHEAAHVETLREQRAHAVVFLGGTNDDPGYREQMAGYARSLVGVGGRLIVCGRPAVPGLPSVPSVEYDNAGGLRALTEHLIELGHSRIAFVGGGPLSTRDARHAGYAAALAAAGLQEMVLDMPGWELEDGIAAVGEVLDRFPGVTAIVASRDLVAVGAIRELRRRGLAVPGDVSVTGFDDLPLTADLTPPLTTVLPRTHEMGEAVGRLAVARRVEDGTSLTLPVDLILRGSTGPPPRSAS